MRLPLDPSRHVTALATASAALAHTLGEVGPEAVVPAGAGRSVAEVVADLVEGHLGTVRALSGRGADAVDLVGATGALMAALALAPAADRARWARRRCHETALVAVDVRGAALGRAPEPDEVAWLTPTLAADGIDELLTGVPTRTRPGLRCPSEGLLVVAPDDVAWGWVVALGPHPARTTRHPGGVPPELADAADWELTGTAVGLFLRLWDRAPAARADTGSSGR